MKDSTTPRIVSTIASATEIICALGMRENLVGISHECDYPPEIRDLPVVTQPRINIHVSSSEIDQQVRDIVKDALSVYQVDSQKLAELHPTHIITQDQCDVCAVSIKDVESAMCDLTGIDCRVISLRPNCLADFFQDLVATGIALSAERQASELSNYIKERMNAISVASNTLRKPTVAAIEWIDPLMMSGNWMPELIEMAGGKAAFGEAGKHSPAIAFADLVAKDPDYILVNPCGFSIERTMQEMHLLESQPGWSNLKATKSNKVFVLDGNRYFNRPGPRLLDSLEILAEVIHPKVFHFGHQDTGWLIPTKPMRA
ncbi:MAG: cobalamin-binding protein [Candidatus Obscuribacterales bacterium]|nr:cobalamin-binding protein [Candidatus Obscuribacterales bacterium]